jgi:hypothetical protein
MLADRGLSPAAVDTAHRMRLLMSADVDEYELADRIVAMNDELNRSANLFQQAWGVLNSGERRAWKTFLTLRKDHGRE